MVYDHAENHWRQKMLATLALLRLNVSSQCEKSMKNFCKILLMVSFLVGCFSFDNRLPDEDFATIQNLKDLEGIYRNKADTKARVLQPATYTNTIGPYDPNDDNLEREDLSEIIWPAKRINGRGPILPNDLSIDTVDHKRIVAIKVQVVDDDVLCVQGLGVAGKLEKEQAFVKGVDFEIKEKRIILKPKSSFMIDPYFIGSISEKAEFGLDSQGTVKYRNKSNMTGLAVTFIPSANGFTAELRYEKASPELVRELTSGSNSTPCQARVEP